MDELVYRVANSGKLENRTFFTEADVLNTIAALEEKNIIFDKFTMWTITPSRSQGGDSITFPTRIIGFAITQIENQARAVMAEARIKKREEAFIDCPDPEEFGPDSICLPER